MDMRKMAVACQAALRGTGTSVGVEPSPVAESPYDYVRLEYPSGQYTLISELREYEQRDGFIVSLWEEGAEDAHLMDEEETFLGALRLALQFAERATGKSRP